MHIGAAILNGRARWMAAVAALALAALLILGRIPQPSAGRTAVEQRLERILSEIYPEGRVSAMVTQDGEGRPSGAVVVAAGLNDIGVALELQRAVVTLLGIDAESVNVVGGEVCL